MKLRLVLAGDIGATRTRLAVFRCEGETRRPIALEVLTSGEFQGLEEAIETFLRGKGLEKAAIASACFGVAGPVLDGKVVGTNLPWTVEARSLRRAFSIEKVELLNDLVALGYGLSRLSKKDFEVLQAGHPRKGNRALIAAGSGLGQAILVWDGQRYLPSPSEGGHVDFAPRNPLETELLDELRHRYDHVSYERLLSGGGLTEIYRFLKKTGRFGGEPRWLSRRLEGRDSAETISEVARLKRSRLCEKTLDLFCSIYGAAAGNLALQAMAVGGLFLGGGIAPKILWILKEGAFLRSFVEKGRLSEILSQVPVKVVLDEKAGLLGAALRARELLEP